MTSETPRDASLAVRTFVGAPQSTPGIHGSVSPTIAARPGSGDGDVTELRPPVPLTFSEASPDPPASTTAVLNESPPANQPVHAPLSGLGQSPPAEMSGENDRVSAYARLDFDSFTFYVQTLQVVLGRRPENSNSADVDVDLGPAKSISRRHAKIFYNFATQRFELTVIGRNGAFVGDVFVERGVTVPLRDRTRLQIGSVAFKFVLPLTEARVEAQRQDPDDDALLPYSSDNGEGASGSSSGQKEDSGGGKSSVAASTSTPGQSAEAKARKRAAKKVKDGDEANFFAVNADASPADAPGPPQPPQTKPRRPPKREYKPEEIPPEYREKPAFSYSHLITSALKDRSPDAGLGLADIYEAIMDLFPYYRYCPSGWQNSVRHNLSSSRSFKKVSKEGKGWLWGLDQEYLAEKERLRKLQEEKALAQQRAAAQAHAQAQARQAQLARQAAQARAAREAQERNLASLTQSFPQQQRPGLSQDTVRLLTGLQQQVQTQLVKLNRPPVDSMLLSNVLAVVVAQAAQRSGGLPNLSNMLRDPAAMGHLILQTLEMLKKHPNPGSQGSGAAASPGQRPAQVHQTPVSSVQPSIPAAGPSRGIIPASTPGSVPGNVPGIAPGTTSGNAPGTAPGVVPTVPGPLSSQSQPSVTPQNNHQTPGPSSNINPSVSQPAMPSSSAPSQAPATMSQTPAKPGQKTDNTSAPKKKPLSREDLAKLLEQAERIPNPPPNIVKMIEQLKAHQHQLEAQEQAAAEASRGKAPAQTSPAAPAPSQGQKRPATEELNGDVKRPAADTELGTQPEETHTSVQTAEPSSALTRDSTESPNPGDFPQPPGPSGENATMEPKTETKTEQITEPPTETAAEPVAKSVEPATKEGTEPTEPTGSKAELTAEPASEAKPMPESNNGSNGSPSDQQ